ncbi:MAG: hypothetical protein LDL50_06470 [Chloroflexi bacterium]|nr:hypothetical protein [Chloroflexota bacterium]
MAKRIGLWIDHKKAALVTQEDGEQRIETIESEVGRRVPYRGASPAKAPYSAQYQQGDNQLDNKFNERLNKFYDKVIAHLQTAESVYIFGPGEAKTEIEKRIARAKIRAQVTAVEIAGKMTERQIASRVKKHFQRG